MIFRQFLYPDTGCAAYLIGCAGKAHCAIVDPQLHDIDSYLHSAERYGMKITHVIDTHIQADHLSGNRRLAELTGAVLGLHASAAAAFPFTGLNDGDELDLGNVRAKVLHTPGHTSESICLLVTDKTRGPEPWLVLTGDTLFVGDAGRPDFGGEAGAQQLYHSLHDKLLTLSEYIEVYPAHFAGSACGRGMSGKPASTIGFERRFNPALQPRTIDEFVHFMTADTPAKPAGFKTIIETNLGQRPVESLAASQI